ncbi:trimeric intracellular cation channel family protein [Oleiagrimonas sp. C23AA]|uniref:trimeric intracellular cation channel family protein n=1 Tax=Oleiagrimonas sp. C23AA TaxID=2719047 RepID=UPI00141E2619|nr:trimeric intracellular cation channel family protein [Oleiagrimonas sp. C23AA]NII11920.1 trimeric intracellular cation channel family protein [Oleiagrimonas sp. C23AA]
MGEHTLFNVIDLAGTFAFAISGALAARREDFDAFGVLAIAFVTACGGGIVRDLCIGAIPPAGLSDWRYLFTAAVAAVLVMVAYRQVERLTYPVRLFDAMGLGLFAVYGAHKALVMGHNAEVAVLVGTLTAVGGGVARDVLLNRTVVIMQHEIYASAAVLGAGLAVLGEYLGWAPEWSTWLPIAACFGLRYLALRLHWNLPKVMGEREP